MVDGGLWKGTNGSTPETNFLSCLDECVPDTIDVSVEFKRVRYTLVTKIKLIRKMVKRRPIVIVGEW